MIAFMISKEAALMSSELYRFCFRIAFLNQERWTILMSLYSLWFSLYMFITAYFRSDSLIAAILTLWARIGNVV